MKRYFLLGMSLMLLSSAAARADDDDQALEKQCKISRAKAHEIACKRVAGTVTDTDIEKTKAGKLYWSIDVRPAKGVEKEVHIDGQSGVILSVKNDDD